MFRLMTRLECVVQGRHAAGSVYLIRERVDNKTALRCTECMNFVGRTFDDLLPSNPKYALKDGWVNGCKKAQPKVMPKDVLELERMASLN